MARLPATTGAEPLLELSSPAEWSKWLRTNHAQSRGVLLRITKKGAKRTTSYAEAREVALAWGWLDSQKRALDANAWLQRFSRRKADSPWSKSRAPARKRPSAE
jgi:uncharacterized protein YdeI (YjbR/CyaY-like superfamily)